MDGTNRPTPDDLAWLAALREQPYAADLFAALRRIEAIDSVMPRLGTSLHPKDDPIRLGQEPDLAFSPSTIASYKSTHANRPPRLGVLSFGLLGANGPLPLHLTDYARGQWLSQDRSTLVEFLDMFHHRLISLFYRAWANSKPTVHADRPQADRFQLYLGSLVGLGQPSLRQRDEVNDAAKRYYAGQIVNHRRNAAGLVALLKDYFSLPIKLIPFVGHWLQLPRFSRAHLGAQDQGMHLGRGAVIGKRVWDCQHKFRLEVGPLNLSQYQEFLPGGKALGRLITWIKNYIGDELAWDLRLVLKRDEVPRLQLGRGTQLGWTTWLTSKTPPRDLSDLCLQPERGLDHG